MEIKIYEDKYRDDMISMVLQAKAALGRPSSLNEDLLDIKANYFQRDRTRQRGESFSMPDRNNTERPRSNSFRRFCTTETCQYVYYCLRSARATSSENLLL